MNFPCYFNLPYHINFLFNVVLNYLQVVTKFLTIESLLDESVDKEINLHIERGGTPLTVTLKVKDLYSITPNHFRELSGVVIHPLSYQQDDLKHPEEVEDRTRGGNKKLRLSLMLCCALVGS
ncbi:protease Do-like 7 [Hordeum vulgare subsp. vulgare]|uniref:protease Do-like 7 n=1 Tax=Hordeum vulgare subsp. vulgare TaxID=112509 RepID=UPI001D1A4295|nr:protease Do-like 7 [Hordeum vulgare subsp. vulgare]